MEKRNYWLKLKEDFFSQPYIKKLRKIAGGDTYTIIYQKILLLSVKTNGYIVFQHIEKTLAKELALILDEDIDNVTVTLEFIKANKLIEQTENENEYLLPDMLYLIGSESESAKWVRAYRDRKRKGLLISSEKQTLQCKDNVMGCKDNVIIDKDIDKDIDPPLAPHKNTEMRGGELISDNNLTKLSKKYKEKEINKAYQYLKYLKSKGKEIKDPIALLFTMLKNGTYADITEIENQQKKKTKKYQIIKPQKSVVKNQNIKSITEQIQEWTGELL
jgi:predicted phage replisome organizer